MADEGRSDGVVVEEGGVRHAHFVAGLKHFSVCLVGFAAEVGVVFGFRFKCDDGLALVETHLQGAREGLFFTIVSNCHLLVGFCRFLAEVHFFAHQLLREGDGEHWGGCFRCSSYEGRFAFGSGCAGGIAGGGLGSVDVENVSILSLAHRHFVNVCQFLTVHHLVAERGNVHVSEGDVFHVVHLVFHCLTVLHGDGHDALVRLREEGRCCHEAEGCCGYILFHFFTILVVLLLVFIR